MTKKTATKAAKMPTPKSLGLPKHVKSVVSMTKDGKRAKRVIIGCQIKHAEAKCAKTRQIATQDVFQVKRCEPCQIAYLRTRRRKTA